MGILSEVIFYQLGKRRGRIQTERNTQPVIINDTRDTECANYERFCKNFGSCDGQECEYD